MVGVSLLVAVTVVLAVLVGAFVFGFGSLDEAPQAAIVADVAGNEITLVHQGGDTLDVTVLTVRIFVDGRPLEHQPDVPGVGMEGFRGAPDGPFNGASTDRRWSVGEVASLTVASTTNAPQPSAGSRVTVRIYADGEAVATARG